MTLDLANLMGLVGAALFVVAYGGAQIGKLDPQKAPALVMNLAGAILVVASLVSHFNLAAMILETIWGLIALFGLIKLARGRRR